MVSISTSLRMAFTFSFCCTPKRCSSSIINKPKSLYMTSPCNNLWVPITMSALPLSRFLMDCVLALPVLKRDKLSICMGQSAKRSRKVSKCCWANNVVGTNTATCLPFCTAMNAALNATSVLPKPTSPQTNLSMGRALIMSLTTALIVVF